MSKDILDIYTDYLIAQNQYATATGLERLLDGELSHDKVTRFLNQSNFSSKDLWAYVKKEVRVREDEDEGVFSFDDTVEEKPHTDENDTVCWHFSHAKSRCVKGINILTGMIRYGDFSVPVCFDAVCKDIEFCSLKDRKHKKKASKTKNETFREMLLQARKNQLKFKYVLADNWFSAKENMDFINDELDKKFIFGMKTNRLVALSKEDKKKGQYQKLNSLDMTDKEVKIVWLKNVSFPVKLLKRVFKNENGTVGVLYLITNDLELGADQIYSIYQKRWRIEEYHKSVKQNASLEKSPTKVARSQRNHIFASIIAYCKLEFLRVKTNLNHFGMKYKLILKANMAAYRELKTLREAV